MFVREEARLAVNFRAARAKLADLTEDGQLISASEAAYSEGFAGIAGAGALATTPVLSSLVMIDVGDISADDDGARLPLRWEAAGPGSGLYPALDGDVSLTPDGNHASALCLTGVYRPPRGMPATMLDRAVLRGVAGAMVRGFLGRLAEAIESPSTPAQSTPA